jgi:streptomycin 6-kinase
MPATGDDGAGRLADAQARWPLTDVRPFAETATSFVYRADYRGRAVALKLLTPYGADEINGARLLGWWGGRGAAELLDATDDMILMEWLAGETLGEMVRCDVGRDGEATAILCDVVAALQQPRPGQPPELTSLELWGRPLRDSDLAFLPVASRPLWRQAQAILAELLETATARVPLHGDLHHDNVIGGSGRWRVIDPKGLIGDPAFEVANIFRNPLGMDALVFDQARIGRLADQFARHFGWERERIVKWAVVLTAISAVWNASEGNAAEWEQKMLPGLLVAI